MKAKNILTIGVAYNPMRGGVAAVENVYSTFYKPFNHIATTTGKSSKLLNAVEFLKAYIKFWWWMLFHKEISIVHVHSSSYVSFWRKRVFIHLAKNFGKKVVFHCHGGNFPEFTSEHFGAVSETINICDCVVALSDWWKQWFENTLHCKKVVVIKNVITEPHIHKVNHKNFSMLFLGLICDNKGIYDLLDVLSEHKSDFLGKAELLIGGNGEVEKLKSIINEKGLQDIVKFKGWVSGKQKEELLNMSDVFVLPSYIEGVPISILEAESYGLAVISTKVGGIPEIVNDGSNGFLITAGDKNALFHSIIEIMSNKGMLENMKNHSAHIVTEHLPDYVEKQLMDMYNNLLGGVNS